MNPEPSGGVRAERLKRCERIPLWKGGTLELLKICEFLQRFCRLDNSTLSLGNGQLLQY